MKCLVTGAAGFIGSHLCERLLQAGHEVVGVDAFLPSASRGVKEANLRVAQGHRSFRFRRCDLRHEPLPPLLEGIEAIFHLAGMTGLTRSWTDFDLFASCNLTATQRLLEAAEHTSTLRRFVFASSSAVYGRYASGDESLPARPISPYGVTKLAAENLCRTYAEERELPLIVLRYFSVYGPRQRPDMGIHRFIQALLTGEPVVIHGDGQQVRGNTYVSDCVDATVAAVGALPGETYNVGGGEVVSVWDVVHKLEILTGRKAAVRREPARTGETRYSCADSSRLHRHLGWQPRIRLDEGMARQLSWQQPGQRAAA